LKDEFFYHELLGDNFLRSHLLIVRRLHLIYECDQIDLVSLLGLFLPQQYYAVDVCDA